jgi:hypothetical protein
MIKHWISIIFLCVIGVPPTVYWAGGLLVGPYEDEQGLPGLMGSIYGDALSGHLSALVLLASPLLFVGIWMLYGKLRRLTRA